MGDNDAGNDPVDRALRLFVYGPLGLACYLKDSAPTFTELFVSRGKRELDGVRRTVEDRLGFAKSQPAPPPSASAQQRVADSMAGLGKVAAQVAASMAAPVVKAGAGAAANVAAGAARSVSANGSGTPGTAGADAPSSAPEAPRPGGIPSVGNPETAIPGAAAAGVGAAGSDLPIAGYDGLSASQVIERLEGMSRGALERVRGYELAHRARRTILASIDNLTA